MTGLHIYGTGMFSIITPQESSSPPRRPGNQYGKSVDSSQRRNCLSEHLYLLQL